MEALHCMNHLGCAHQTAGVNASSRFPRLASPPSVSMAACLSEGERSSQTVGWRQHLPCSSDTSRVISSHRDYMCAGGSRSLPQLLHYIHGATSPPKNAHTRSIRICMCQHPSHSQQATASTHPTCTVHPKCMHHPLCGEPGAVNECHSHTRIHAALKHLPTGIDR